MFSGRGDYVAFDEGWYLLLGRSLMSGEGFTLTGLQHVTLSPLFPILAGAVNLLIGDIVWSGRLVAAAAAALLVVPCWFIFHSIGGRRTATLGCAIIIALPALAPFVVPYWVGRDLWVGAEPLLHLFLFTGVATALRALGAQNSAWLVAAGVSFGLAYLSRPEAVLAVGVFGVMFAALHLRFRRIRGLIGIAALALGFVLTAAPYWVYLHDVLGRWAISGRAVPVAISTASSTSTDGRGAGAAVGGHTAVIEQMLWGSDATAYVQHLYGLHPSGTRLASSYWGVPLEELTPAAPVEEAAGAALAVASSRNVEPAGAARNGGSRRSSRLVLFGRALLAVIPWYVWPLILAGVAARRTGSGRKQLAMELLFAVPLLIASIVIARFVAIDPRTQLFLLPLAAFYMARGLRVSGVGLDRLLRTTNIRRGFAGAVLAAAVLIVLAGTQARWLYMSLGVGSPHHLAGESNRDIGRALNGALPADAVVTSWHPAIAIYADRDWRVLPNADLPAILRYADAVGSEWVVISRFYPGPDFSAETASEHAVIRVPRPLPGRDWRLELQRGSAPYLTGSISSTEGAAR